MLKILLECYHFFFFSNYFPLYPNNPSLLATDPEPRQSANPKIVSGRNVTMSNCFYFKYYCFMNIFRCQFVWNFSSSRCWQIKLSSQFLPPVMVITWALLLPFGFIIFYRNEKTASLVLLVYTILLSKLEWDSTNLCSAKEHFA